MDRCTDEDQKTKCNKVIKLILNSSDALWYSIGQSPFSLFKWDEDTLNGLHQNFIFIYWMQIEAQCNYHLILWTLQS